MKRLRKFLTSHQRDRHLLVSAALLLGAIRLGLWLLPFQTLRRLLARITSVSTELQASDQAFVGKVVWAVEGASRYMPGGVKCLARALATQVLLGRSGHPTQLCIGVAKDKQGNLEAHAWVESQGRIIIGGLRDMTRFTPLPSLERERV